MRKSKQGPKSAMCMESNQMLIGYLLLRPINYQITKLLLTLSWDITMVGIDDLFF